MWPSALSARGLSVQQQRASPLYQVVVRACTDITASSPAAQSVAGAEVALYLGIPGGELYSGRASEGGQREEGISEEEREGASPAGESIGLARSAAAAQMTIDLYYLPPSPPCRSVMMLAKHLGIHLNLKVVNVLKGEQLKASFRKINPQHTIPTMDDNGFILWESRAIMEYMVMKYAKNDSLYPREPVKRALVEHRLYFDLGTLFDAIIAYHAPVIFGKMDTPPEQLLAPMERAFELLDGYLKDSEFAVGDELTIADYSLVSTVCTAKAFGVDIGRFDNVAAWYARCKKAMEKCGFEEINEAGARTLGGFYKANLKSS